MKLTAYLSHATLYADDEFSGYTATLRLLKDAGFDGYDLALFATMPVKGTLFHGPDYALHAKRLRAEADKIGLFCNQTHAPFFGYCTEGMTRAEYEAMLPRALEITAILGGKVCVVHPEREWTPEENAEKLFLPLLPYAKKYGVPVALENLWFFRDGKFVPCACSTAESYLRHLALLDERYFCACLDVGHATLLHDYTSPEELIRALGGRLRALHVHDNDGRDDAHLMPYCGDTDWDKVTAALKEIGYSGDFTFEVSGDRFPVPLAPSSAALLHDIGRYLISKI